MADRTVWYIDPCGDPVTNRLIAEQCPEEDACGNMMCSDGHRRNLWRCDRSVVREIVAARPELRIRFQLFVQEGKHGKIRPWHFEKSIDAKGKKHQHEQLIIQALEEEARVLLTSAE